MKFPGRSRLLRIADAPEVRPRPFLRRRLIWLIFLSAVTLLCLSVLQESLPKTGILRLFYHAHDSFWVPLRAWVWTRTGGGALWWLLPLALLALLALGEYLGLFEVLRRTQIAMLRLGLLSPLSRVMLTVQQHLGWGRGFEKMILEVAEADFRRELDRAREAQEKGAARPSARLLRHSLQLAYLKPNDASAQLGILEALAISRETSEDTASEARARCLQIWPDEARSLLELSETEAPGLDALFDRLRSGRLSAPEAAAAMLAMARPQAGERGEVVEAWLTEWARKRHVVAPDAVALAEAETLIDFGHWAALAEARLPRAEVDWLHGLLPTAPLRRELGELAAAGGKGPQDA